MTERTDTPASAVCASLAEAALEGLRAQLSVPLDYSPPSVGAIEYVLGEFSKQGLRSATHPNTVYSLGALLGEIIVRQLGGQWVYARDLPGGYPGTDPRLPIVRLNVGGACNPIAKVAGRLNGAEADNIVYFYKVVALQAAGGLEDTAGGIDSRATGDGPP